jgi:carnitine monooxygenase subunit
VNRAEQIDEIKKLIGLLDGRTTAVWPETMRAPVRPYLDHEVFDREVSALFRKQPQFVGFSSRVRAPGDYCALTIADQVILVVRGEDGVLRAFVNFCRHRGAQLVASGDGCANKAFRCPYHGWRYGLDGSLLTVPYGAQGFPDLDRAVYGLTPLQVEERYGLIFVMPDANERFDIDELLGDAGDDLASWRFDQRAYVETRQYSVPVNWKLNLDTFGESYHFSTLHPTTFGVKTHDNVATRVGYKNVFRMCHPARLVDQMRQRPEDEWDVSQLLSTTYYIFPSTILFVVRGHMEAFTILPGERPGESLTNHQMYLLTPDEPSEEQRREMDAMFEQVSHVLNTEDYPVVASIQRAFNANPDQSMIFGRNELGLHYVHERIDRAMGRI